MVQRAVHFAPILGDVIARVRDGMLLAPDLSKSQKAITSLYAQARR